MASTPEERIRRASVFTSEVTLTSPWRAPHQMLADQVIRGHASLHDDNVAEKIGLTITGAPIEAPTHFSQFDPLAHLIWGDAWFERGCISCHFRTMVAEGETVQATLTTQDSITAKLSAQKPDGTPVLEGSASLMPLTVPTLLDERRAAATPPTDLVLVDQLTIGMKKRTSTNASIDFDSTNGPLYPFSQNEKLAQITEPHPYYTEEGGPRSPWGRAIVPMEMISVLAAKVDPMWPISAPAVGLFLDLEIRLVDGPVFVGQEYTLDAEIVGVSASRRTESYWTQTTISEPDGKVVAIVLLHAGLFKDSVPS